MSGKGTSARPSMLRSEGKATPSPLVLFSYFPPKIKNKWRKLPPHRIKRPKTRNKRTFLGVRLTVSHLESHSSTADDISNLTWQCRGRESLQLHFSRHEGTHASVPAICNHERDVKTKPREIKSFLPCPLPDFGAFSMTNNSVILWYFS